MDDAKALSLFRESNYTAGEDLLASRKWPTYYTIYFRLSGEETVSSVQAGACHAGLRSGTPRPDYTVVLLDKTDGVNLEGFTIYLDWLANRSPFQQAFISKDAREMVELGRVLVTSHCKQQMHLGALQLARLSTSEYRGSFHALCIVLSRFPELPPLFSLWLFVALKVTFSANKGQLYGYRPAGVISVPSNHLPFSSPQRRTRALYHRLVDRVIPPSAGDRTFFQAASWGGNASSYLGTDITRPMEIDIEEMEMSQLVSDLLKGEPTVFTLGGLDASDVEPTSPWAKAAALYGKYITVASDKGVSPRGKIGINLTALLELFGVNNK